MKEQSLKADLKARTTEELDAMLAYCLREENYVNHSDTVCTILRVLHEREYRETLPEEPEVRCDSWQEGKWILRPAMRLFLKLRRILQPAHSDDFSR